MNNKIDVDICTGIGDCLAYCQIYDLYRDVIQYNYNVSDSFIYNHGRDERHINRVKNIFNLFNVPLNMYKGNQKHDIIVGSVLLEQYPIYKQTLGKYIKNIDTCLPDKYITLCLNARIVDPDHSLVEYERSINIACDFFNNTQFNLPIVIIGDKKNRDFGYVINYSFYDRLDKTKFIDKSSDINLCIDSNIDNLQYDINIIMNSEETIQFGIGGSLCLNLFFSNNFRGIVKKGFDKELPDEFLEKWINLSKNFTNYDNFDNISSLLNDVRDKYT
jgi:ferredoxin